MLKKGAISFGIPSVMLKKSIASERAFVHRKHSTSSLKKNTSSGYGGLDQLPVAAFAYTILLVLQHIYSYLYQWRISKLWEGLGINTAVLWVKKHRRVCLK